MPYVPSHLEHCPFWVNKTDNLENQCTVPLPPEATDLFTLTLLDYLTTNRNIIPYDSGILYMPDSGPSQYVVNGAESYTEICDNSSGLDTGFLHVLPDDSKTRYPYNYNDYSNFWGNDCIATQAASNATVKLQESCGNCSTNYRTYPISSIDNSYMIMGLLRLDASTNYDYVVVRSTDGYNFTEVAFQNSLGVNSVPMFMLRNKHSNGGFLYSGVPGGQGYTPIITSSADGITWTDRGLWPNTIPEDDYYPHAVFFYYNDKVCVNTYNNSIGEYVATIFTLNAGNTVSFSHYVTLPNSYDYGLYEIDEDTETLFGIFGTSSSGLYKSMDWGLTWELVSALDSVKYFYSQSRVRFNDTSNESYLAWSTMIINSGYLSIMVEDFIYEVNEGDTRLTKPALIQFKLSDIL